MYFSLIKKKPKNKNYSCDEHGLYHKTILQLTYQLHNIIFFSLDVK